MSPMAERLIPKSGVLNWKSIADELLYVLREKDEFSLHSHFCMP
jgi:hypothetical protein